VWIVAKGVKLCLSGYFVCLWTSQEVQRGVPHAGQDSTRRVIPLALHWQHIQTHTTTFFFLDGIALTEANRGSVKSRRAPERADY